MASIAQKRLALVVGNSNYPIGKLTSPRVDAEQVTMKLRELDYEVTRVLDLDQRSLRKAIVEFSARVRQSSGSSALFYYSGHGMQVNGENYLIPIDSDIAGEDDVQSQGIRLDEVITRLNSAGSSPNVLILDACRNNPFEKKFKDASMGLARPQAPPGTLIAFAAAPGAVAPQAFGGRPSPYTERLVRRLSEDTPALVLFQGVANDVLKASGGSQRPHIETAAGLDTSFRLGRQSRATSTPITQRSKLESFLLGEAVFAGFRPAQLLKFASFNLQYTGDKFLVSTIAFAIDAQAKEEHSLAILREISEGKEFQINFRLNYKDDPISDIHRASGFFDKGLLSVKASTVFRGGSTPIEVKLYRPLAKSEISSSDIVLWVYLTAGTGSGSGGGWGLKDGVLRD